MYNVLIVDDEKQSREVIIFLLQKKGIKLNIVQASNGKEALNILENQSIDILLTDVKMPFFNGIELASEARKLYSNIEILFFSGYDDFDYIKQAMSLNVIDYILKPIDTDEFYKSINKIIQTLNENNIENLDISNYIDEKISNKSQNIDDCDSFSLENIAIAIGKKDFILLKSSIDEIANTYTNRADVSHIYIKYLSTTILHMFAKEMPNFDDNELHVITDEVYNMKKISNIFNLIELYTNKFIDNFAIEQNSSNKAIETVCQYINDNYNSDLSLQVLADLVYLNPKYLSRIFVQDVGVTMNKYIKNLRFEKAKNLLLTTNMKISDVSKSVGFSNVSYFCKVFQTEYNVTPEAFRQAGGN